MSIVEPSPVGLQVRLDKIDLVEKIHFQINEFECFRELSKKSFGSTLFVLENIYL